VAQAGVALEQQCCDACASDPTCAVSVISGGTCYIKFTTDGRHTAGADGTACVKKSAGAISVAAPSGGGEAWLVSAAMTTLL
jgi:hypothetical protein